MPEKKKSEIKKPNFLRPLVARDHGRAAQGHLADTPGSLAPDQGCDRCHADHERASGCSGLWFHQAYRSDTFIIIRVALVRLSKD